MPPPYTRGSVVCALSKQHQWEKRAQTLWSSLLDLKHGNKEQKSVSQEGEGQASQSSGGQYQKSFQAEKIGIWSPTKSRPELVTVWIYLRSNLFKVKAEEINVWEGVETEITSAVFLSFGKLIQTTMQYLDRHRASCKKDTAHRTLSSPEVKLEHNHSSESVFSKAPVQSLSHSMWATLSTVCIYFQPQILDKCNHYHYID